MNARPEHPSDDDRLILAGELTIYTVAETLTRLRAHLGEHSSCDLDLCGISELDGAGIQLLLWLRETARLRGIALRLIAHGSVVDEVLGLLQLGALFDLDAAGAAVGGDA